MRAQNLNTRMNNTYTKPESIQRVSCEHAKEVNLTKIVNYIDLCTTYGTENLWNSWCEYLSTKSIHWVDGNHVPEVHYTYLVGE